MKEPYGISNIWQFFDPPKWHFHMIQPISKLCVVNAKNFHLVAFYIFVASMNLEVKNNKNWTRKTQLTLVMKLEWADRRAAPLTECYLTRLSSCKPDVAPLYITVLCFLPKIKLILGIWICDFYRFSCTWHLFLQGSENIQLKMIVYYPKP